MVLDDVEKRCSRVDKKEKKYWRIKKMFYLCRAKVGGNSSVVEHHLAKVRVAGSSPVIRSEERGSSQPLIGGLAERLGTGLQSRLHRFESGTHLGRLAQR